MARWPQCSLRCFQHASVIRRCPFPYHVGVGWFGGFLPAIAFAIIAASGNIYAGLWYPVITASIAFVVSLIFVKETKDVDIRALD